MTKFKQYITLIFIGTLVFCSPVFAAIATKGEVVRIGREIQMMNDQQRPTVKLEKDSFVILTGVTQRVRNSKSVLLQAHLQNGTMGWVPSDAIIKDEKTFSNSLKYAQAKESHLDTRLFVSQFRNAWSQQLTPKSKIGGILPKKEGDNLVWTMAAKNGVILGKLVAAQITPEGKVFQPFRIVKGRDGKFHKAQNPVPKGTVWQPIELFAISPVFPIPLGLSVGSNIMSLIENYSSPEYSHGIYDKRRYVQFEGYKNGSLRIYHQNNIITKVEYRQKGSFEKRKNPTSTVARGVTSLTVDTGAIVAKPQAPQKAESKVTQKATQKNTGKTTQRKGKKRR